MLMVRTVKDAVTRKVARDSIKKERYNSSSGLCCSLAPGQDMDQVLFRGRLEWCDCLTELTAWILTSITTKLGKTEVVTSQHLDMHSRSNHILCGQNYQLICKCFLALSLIFPRQLRFNKLFENDFRAFLISS